MGTIIAIGAGLAVLAITKILLLGAALAEATAIYGFVIALLIIILLS